MAPSGAAGKRIKGVQFYRPFIYGTIAKPFDDKDNPKPPGVPDDHTHSWTVFVKGVDGVDVTYWLRRVQFKLHESIPNPVRTIEGQRGKAFELRETGWGEFDIAIKLYFVAESGEKAQTLYHMLRLHPYGTDETAREAMRASGCVPSLAYEEQLFNEPYEHFYDILSSGAVPTGWSKPLETMSDITSIKNISLVKSGGKGKGGGGGLGAQTPGGVLERSAMIPLITRLPAEPFSRETEQLEVKKLRDAALQLAKKERKDVADLRRKEAYLSKLKADRIAAEKADGTA